MLDRLEILAARLRRLISRTRWAGRLLGYPPPPEGEHEEAGLVLIQIDGLGMDVLRRALAEGRMPFLAHLLSRESYELHDLYTGMPSSTPAVQAELFYGQKTAVPAFGYHDAELDRNVSCNDPAVAAALESRMQQTSDGLLAGGSSWSNIFAGGASEPHLCAATAGFDLLWKSLDPPRALGLILWYSWSLLRVFGHGLVESLAAVLDFFKHHGTGRELWAELRFVPTRVLVTGVMREIVTAGAAIDADRGLPIIHLNYLGHDEHAHRRGPHSRLARWTLRGIDNSIQRVWLAAHRSTARDYQVWIYSDHGHETVIPYPLRYGRSVSEAVEEVVRREQKRVRSEARRRAALGAERAHWLTRDLPDWARRRIHPEAVAHGEAFLGDAATPVEAGIAEEEKPEVEVVHQGPVGMVYLRRPLEDGSELEVARRLAMEAHIPLVLRGDEGGTAHAFTHHGRQFHLPEDGSRLFGEDHPFLREVVEDTLRLVHHDEAGDFVLMGFDRDQPYSLQLEHGSHGGPDRRETHAVALLPREATAGHPVHGILRPEALRGRARRVLGGILPRSPRETPRVVREEGAPGAAVRRLRLLSYNVHGCRGMDGKYSPQRIVRVIAREQPDIICLQEIDQGRTRSGGVSQIEQISRSLQADYSFHSVFEVDDGEFGNAILSHHRLVQLGRGPLPALGRSVPSLEPRGVLRVQVCLGDGCIEVVNTHLSILERERQLQVAELISGQWLRPDGGGVGNGNGAGAPAARPLVLCGDFNASPRSFTCRRVGEYLDSIDQRWPRARKLKTWSSRIALRRIDQIFVNGSVEVVGAHVPRNRLTRVASDHLPLVVDLEVNVQSGAAE